MTNEPIGKRLAVQVRNTLKRLVESGAISGSLSFQGGCVEEGDEQGGGSGGGSGGPSFGRRPWLEGGDVEAMKRLGYFHGHGKHEAPAEKGRFIQAFMWLKRVQSGRRRT